MWRLAHRCFPGRQGTVIVERWWKVPLAGEGRKPRLRRRHRVYKLVEDTKHRPKENLELILTQSVESKTRAEAPPLRLVQFGISFFLPVPLNCLPCFFFVEIISSICEKRKP